MTSKSELREKNLKIATTKDIGCQNSKNLEKCGLQWLGKKISAVAAAPRLNDNGGFLFYWTMVFSLMFSRQNMAEAEKIANLEHTHTRI